MSVLQAAMDQEARVERRAEQVEDRYEFVDEAGKVLPEFGPLELDREGKIVVARLSLKWKQSIDTTLERMVRVAIQRYVRKRRDA